MKKDSNTEDKFNEVNSPLAFYNKLATNEEHNHDDCDCEECHNHEHLFDSDEHNHTHSCFKNIKEKEVKKQDYPMYDLDEDFDENEDYYCDLDPTKICDNCGKCLDTYNTDENGYIKIPIDKIETDSDVSLDELYKMYGLDDDDE